MSAGGLDALATTMLTFLLDAAVRALIVAGVAGLVGVSIRARRASVGLATWTIVLYVATAMPAIGAMLPGIRWSLPIVLPETPAARSIATPVRPFTPAVSAGPARDVRATAPGAAQMPAPVVAAERVSNLLPPSSTSVSWPVVALGIYLAGAIVLLLRACLGWVLSRRLRQAAPLIEDAGTLARLQECATSTGLRHPPELAESGLLVVPITMSVFNPVIVLPTMWRSWDADRLDAVLRHELSHIARRDALTQRLSLVYRAIFWFSPLGWWLRRRLAILAEHASDEAVLDAGVDRTAYAEVVLGFFEALKTDRRRAHWPAIAMARGTGASRRVERILAWPGSRGRKLTRSIVAAMIVVTSPMVILAAAVRPVATSSLSIPIVVSALTGMPSLRPLAAPELPVTVAFTPAQAATAPAPAAGGRAFVLLIDDMSVRGADTIALRRVLQSIRDQLVKADDLLAIAFTGSSPASVKFATDPGHARLNDAINKTMGSAFDRPSPEGTPAAAAERNMAHTSFRTAREILAKHTEVQDRRLTFVYISAGYRVDPLKDGQPGAGQDVTDADLVADIATLIRSANHANVRFYVINPAGVQSVSPPVAPDVRALHALADNTGGFCICSAADSPQQGLERINREIVRQQAPDVDSQTPAPSPPPDGRSVRVDEVITTVRARDAQGTLVPGLTATDFRVFEDGVEQKIDVFTPWVIHRTGSQALATTARPMSASRTFMIFVDDMNVDAASRPSLLRVLGAVRNMLRDDDLIGIVSTGYSSIEVDLGYDRGHARLDQAIARVASTGASGNQAGASLGTDRRNYLAHTALKTAFDVISRTAQLKSADLDDRQKAFIYISSGYALESAGDAPTHRVPAVPRTNTTNVDSFAKPGTQFTNADLTADLRAVTEAAKTANWTIYPITPTEIRTGPDGMTVDEWSTFIAASRSLTWLSSGTGGFTLGPADFPQGLTRIGSDATGEPYYQVAYSSTNHDLTQKTRKVEIRATRPGLQLSYRQDYTIK